MTTRIYIEPKKKFPYHLEGYWKHYKPRPKSFRNPFFPPIWLRPHPRLDSKFTMIAMPWRPVFRVWAKLLFKLCNFKIGRIHVITDTFDDRDIDYDMLWKT